MRPPAPAHALTVISPLQLFPCADAIKLFQEQAEASLGSSPPGSFEFEMQRFMQVTTAYCFTVSRAPVLL